MPENSYCAKALKSVITIVIDDNSPSTRDEMQCCKKCLIDSKNEMSCNLSGLIPMEKFEEFSFGMFGVDSFYSRCITNLPLKKLLAQSFKSIVAGEFSSIMIVMTLFSAFAH